ncbi:MAG: hypothetical protein ABL890_01090 [Candidatus Peribacteraceae bacterium]
MPALTTATSKVSPSFEAALEQPALRPEYIRKVPLGSRADYLAWVRYSHDAERPPVAVEQISSHLFGYRHRASNVLVGPALFETAHPGDIVSELRDNAGMQGKLLFYHPEIYADLLMRCPSNISQKIANTRLELVARQFQLRRIKDGTTDVSDTLRQRVEEEIEKLRSSPGIPQRYIF